jgi:signal transduction histidine kinase
MAAEMGFPLLEGVGGAVRAANPPARDRLGKDPAGEDLIAVTAQLLQVATDDPDLLALVARAETAGASTGTVGQARLMIHRPEAGHLQLLAVPAQLGVPTDLERRAAAGDVAAGVSHEVANALSAIVGWSQLGQQRGDAGSTEIFGLIEHSARSARAAARRLLDAVRSPAHQPSVAVDLNALITDVVRLSQLQARERDLEVTCQVQPGLFVLGTSSALFTIVWNLVINAVDAVPQGGHVAVTAAAQDDAVRLVVSDDGPGMDERQRHHVFDPYFTTKASGTGLGLPLVKDAVESIGGRILLETEAGRGASFFVELVRADPDDTQAPSDTGERRRSGVRGRPSAARLRVLVVEDDLSLRQMMHTTLTLQEAEVDAVASAAEALQQQGPYDVALVDLALTDVRGDHLVAELRRREIIGAAAIVTGASEPPRLHPGGKPDMWLRKPFEPSDLFDAVLVLAAVGDETKQARS